MINRNSIDTEFHDVDENVLELSNIENRSLR